MQNAELGEAQAGFFIFCCACGNLVPLPGIKPGHRAQWYLDYNYSFIHLSPRTYFLRFG